MLEIGGVAKISGKSDHPLRSYDRFHGNEKGQNHIFGHISGSNCHRPFVLCSYESLLKGASNVTLTLTFDLDLE